MQKYIKIHPADTVAVALCPLPAGTVAVFPAQSDSTASAEVTLSEDIPQGHKFALLDLAEGESVIKYGASIGITKAAVPTGSWVHTHNMKTALGDLLTYTYDKQNTPLPTTEERFFQGYRRSDGKVGVRNEIWIIPTVGCVNNVATVIERETKNLLTTDTQSSSQYCKSGDSIFGDPITDAPISGGSISSTAISTGSNKSSISTGCIDAIAAFPHPYGCSQMGDDQEHTRQILADLINHPNAGGVLVLGLGCENSNISELKKYIGTYDPNRVKFLECQSSEDEISDALALMEELIQYAGSFRREPISCSELIIGMKCGGSDGLSGITANPTVGAFSDLLISKGGSTILTEVPEMFGAETLLMNRCENEELFDQTVTLINDFKNYFTRHDQTIYENPSPGNKKGGISTLEDKSLGCTQKSGSAPVRGVLSYGEPIKEKGLNLLSAPGNDLVASTALAASGAHIVLFTTGRGTPFASPVPTVKISSNSALYEKKKNWIDFNCGTLVEGGESETDSCGTNKEAVAGNAAAKDAVTDNSTVDINTVASDPGTLGKQLFEYVLAVASGKKVKSELAGFHDMAIFKQGVTL